MWPLTFIRSAVGWGGIACRSWWTRWLSSRTSSGISCSTEAKIHTRKVQCEFILNSVNSFFLVDADGTVQVQQEGTFRSNCMDCLDRTNVVQSLLARRSLQSQLQVKARSHTSETHHNQTVCLYVNTEVCVCVYTIHFIRMNLHTWIFLLCEENMTKISFKCIVCGSALWQKGLTVYSFYNMVTLASL